MNIEPFVESNELLGDAAALQRRLRKEGLLFFRGLLPRADVLAVRQRILEICQAAEWIKPGTELMEGITDHVPILEGEEAWHDVYHRVQKLEEFHRLKLHPHLRRLMECLFDEPVVALPNTVGRIAFTSDHDRATQPHQDWLYIQGSVDTLTVWVPLGDIPAAIGGLMVQPGSHKAGILYPRKAAGPGGHTVTVDPTLPWAAADYRAGDVVLFPSLTVHAARPSATPGRLRVSMDFRYVGLSHTICASNLKPHFNWLGERFSWEQLDRDWQDASLRRYWERMAALKIVPLERRLSAKA